MKEKDFKAELGKLSLEALITLERELRSQLFELRLNKKTSHLKNYAQIRLLRKNIARVKTLQHEKEMLSVADYIVGKVLQSESAQNAFKSLHGNINGTNKNK